MDGTVSVVYDSILLSFNILYETDANHGKKQKKGRSNWDDGIIVVVFVE